MIHDDNRRAFLSAAAFAGAGLALVGFGAKAQGSHDQPEPAKKEKPSEVNATEDLMREHGVLRRVLLVYEEGLRRIAAGLPPSADTFSSAAGIIQHFIEAYHEKLEEEQVFPRLVKAGKLKELVRVLLAQHQAGRRLTLQILREATPAALGDKARSQALVTAIDQFVRMYEPHACREDTVLFPAFHGLFSDKEFDELGDRFEEQEHQLLGNAGFEGTVQQVADLEKSLGIYDLALFTPK